MESMQVTAVFEDGVLRPLQPLELQEHELVSVSIQRTSGDVPDGEYEPHIIDQADPTVTLKQVQEALAGIPGSLVDDFSSARDERF